MKDLIKRILHKLSDIWYGALPILLLVGVPISLCIIIGWKKILKLLAVLVEIGGGSWLIGAILILFSAFGLLSICYAVVNAIEIIGKKLGSKWAILYIIVTSLGIVALTILLERS